jgi:lipoprotein-anchoring transpeptidase ErfK/SrfK
LSGAKRHPQRRRVLGLLPVAAGVTVLWASTAVAASGWTRRPAAAVTTVAADRAAGIAAPSRRRGATLAQIVVAVEARSRPGAGRGKWWAATATSWSGEPQVLLALGSAVHDGRVWVRLLLPIRPDGATGWIPRDNVTLLSTRYWITVDTRTRTVTIDHDGRLVHRYEAVIGKPATPTPDGLAAIYEKDPQPDPGGFLGPWALPLTTLSNTLLNFGGGPGRIAIHGRAGASLQDPLGSARSHGCIRIDNAPIVWMAHHIPQGAPVQIIGGGKDATDG